MNKTLSADNLDFEKGDGLLPAIVQDAATRKVLMLGYMNKEALEITQKENKVTFYSRTKNQLWTKGETSGNYLELVAIIPDCDRDTLLVKARPRGVVCHKGWDTCFNEKNLNLFTLESLQSVIKNRKITPRDGSYTSELFKEGVPKIARKVGEESIETVIESIKNDKERLLEESADLVYHLMVLLTAFDLDLDDLIEVLKERHQG